MFFSSRKILSELCILTFIFILFYFLFFFLFLPYFHFNDHCFSWQGLQRSLDLQLPFYVPLACLFFVLHKTDAPIFFLYYPLVWSERFVRIQKVLQSKDVYEPIIVNKFIQANNCAMFMTIIKHMIERGLPFQLKEYSISYYELPSVASHSPVHFLWKKSINDSADCPEQLKTIHDLKNKSKTYYSRMMKHKVRKKILRLGIVKPCQANFIIKDLLGDKQWPLMNAKRTYSTICI